MENRGYLICVAYTSISFDDLWNDMKQRAHSVATRRRYAWITYIAEIYLHQYFRHHTNMNEGSPYINDAVVDDGFLLCSSFSSFPTKHLKIKNITYRMKHSKYIAVWKGAY